MEERFWQWVENLGIYKALNKNKLLGKIFNREMISYLFFGVMTTIVSVGLFWIFDKLFSLVGWCGIVGLFRGKDYAYIDANVLSWCGAVLFGFVTNKLFVFRSKTWERSTAVREFFSFIGARLSTLLIDTALMFLFVTVMSIDKMIAKLIVQVVVVVLNYVFSKLFVFKKNQKLEDGVAAAERQEDDTSNDSTGE